MVQMMTSLLWKSYHNKIYTYGIIIILMISLCFFQFQNQNFGKSNFGFGNYILIVTCTLQL